MAALRLQLGARTRRVPPAARRHRRRPGTGVRHAVALQRRPAGARDPREGRRHTAARAARRPQEGRAADPRPRRQARRSVRATAPRPRTDGAGADDAVRAWCRSASPRSTPRKPCARRSSGRSGRSDLAALIRAALGQTRSRRKADAAGGSEAMTSRARVDDSRVTSCTSHELTLTDARTHERRRSPNRVIREMTRVAHQHGAINLAQGFPDFPMPRADEGRRVRGDPRRHQPVRHHLGRAVAAPRDRREVPALVRHAGRHRDRDHGDLRRDRGDGRGVPGADRSRATR